MNSRATRRSREQFSSLPAQVQRQAREAYRLFRENPTHPGLHFKRVHHGLPIDSARVGINYRASGPIDGETVGWFWIGSHADYDQCLNTL